MAKPASDYSDEHLKLVITRYTAQGSTTRSAIPLVDFLREREKRQALGLGPRGLALNIVRIAKQSKNGRASYSDVWHCYNDGLLPQGNHWIKQFIKPFDDLVTACVAMKLPLITTLITEKDKTIQSPDGIRNLWDFAVANDVAVGNSPEAYVRMQAVEAAQLSIGDIEEAFAAYA
jgi:hypothetical protein